MLKDNRAISRLLWVSSGDDMPQATAVWVAQRGWAQQWVQTLDDAIAALAQSRHVLALVSDQGFDDEALLSFAQGSRQQGSCTPLILVTQRASEAHAIAALRAGYGDYLHSAASPAEWNACLLKNLPAASQPAAKTASTAQDLIGDSAPMQAIKRQLPRFAAADCTVLVIGETGTGKERVAEQIHQLSARAAQPFVAINCAALPDTLLESELFGYEKGAFTGAVNAHPGKLKLAEGGTLFLDEIGDMSAQGQAKLLRALESREFYRLGARAPTRFDVRIVAATNQPLESLVAEGRFRKDLYFRLNVVRLDLPPLRERRDDVPDLLRHYLVQFNARFGMQAKLAPELVDALCAYDWPGNVRELKNMLEAALICAGDELITLDDLPLSFSRQLPQASAVLSEREVLIATLSNVNWNKSRAAEALQWSRMTLYRKLAKYSIQIDELQAPPSLPGVLDERTQVTLL